MDLMLRILRLFIIGEIEDILHWTHSFVTTFVFSLVGKIKVTGVSFLNDIVYPFFQVLLGSNIGQTQIILALASTQKPGKTKLYH